MLVKVYHSKNTKPFLIQFFIQVCLFACSKKEPFILKSVYETVKILSLLFENDNVQ